MFSNLLLQLIALFLPTQLGLHFWPDFSRATGIKVDFLSPTLYFTDLLLLAYIATSTPKILKWLKKNYLLYLVLLTFAGLNIFLGTSPANSFFWWLRSFGYILFFLCLRLQKVSWSQIKKPLLFSGLFVVAVQVLEQLHQGSLGGPLYWLGERSFSFSTSGLAKVSLGGLDIVRSPSLFSHPNSLAGFLLVVYYLLSTHKSPLWSKIIIFTGLLLTFSKGALLAFFLVLLLKIDSVALTALFTLFSFIELFFPLLPESMNFIADRLFFMNFTQKILRANFLFGVGLGNFIPSLSHFLPGSFLTAAKLQPVHNLFLLFLSELGIVGALLLSTFAYYRRRYLGSPKFLGLVALVCITGAFDHYWWTLPQNRLILCLASAILL